MNKKKIPKPIFFKLRQIMGGERVSVSPPPKKNIYIYVQGVSRL